MLQFANIVLGESGASRCVRCHRSAAEDFRDAATCSAEIADVASAWTGGTGPNLSLAGAEPLRHPALFDLLGAARAAGASRIRIESDAHAMATADTAEKVVRAGVRHLTVTLFGSSAEAHDALTGDRGSLEATLAGVRGFTEAARAIGARVHVAARVPVCRHTLRDTAGIVTLAAESGANSVLLAIDDPELDLRQAAPWLEAACDTGVVYPVWVEVEGIPYCLAGSWSLHLASNYRAVGGEKGNACSRCPLDDVCGGAVPGSSRRVVSVFAPPPGAAGLAERVRASFQPARGGSDA